MRYSSKEDNETKTIPELRLFAVKQIPKQPGYAWVTESSLRHWIGLPSDVEVFGERIASSHAYFDALVEIGFDPFLVELCKLGRSRSGESLPIFLPLIQRQLKGDAVTEQDDNFPLSILINDIPSWTYNAHTPCRTHPPKRFSANCLAK